jgi:hypothetical protein
MDWAEDIWTVQAADAAAAYAGRAWNLDTRRWETISGVFCSRSAMTRYKLRTCEVRVTNSSGVNRRGIICHLYVVGDPQATNRLIALPGAESLQRGDVWSHWGGEYPLLAGFQYHYSLGGVIATDIVHAQIGYSL